MRASSESAQEGGRSARASLQPLELQVVFLSWFEVSPCSGLCVDFPGAFLGPLTVGCLEPTLDRAALLTLCCELLANSCNNLTQHAECLVERRADLILELAA